MPWDCGAVQVVYTRPIASGLRSLRLGRSQHLQTTSGGSVRSSGHWGDRSGSSGGLT